MPLELSDKGRAFRVRTWSKPTPGWELMFPPQVPSLPLLLQLLLMPLLLQFLLPKEELAPSLKSTLWLLELSFRPLLPLLGSCCSIWAWVPCV